MANVQVKRRSTKPVGPGNFVSVKGERWKAEMTPKLQRIVTEDGQVKDVPLTDAKGNVIFQENPAARHTIDAIAGKDAESMLTLQDKAPGEK